MGFLRWFFGKRGPGGASASTKKAAIAQEEVSADDRAQALFETYKELGVSDEVREKAVSILSEILEILDLETTELHPGIVYWQRAMRYKYGSNYDAALEDFNQARLFAQRRGDSMLDRDCVREIDEIRQQKRRAEIEASAGERAAKFQTMEQQSQALWGSGPEADAAFNDLFNDLENADADIRLNASRILADSNQTLRRLVSIYEKCLNSDPPRAHLAGRVLGRRIAKGLAEPISSDVPKMMYGLDISVIPCSCAYCGAMNIGIAAPPRGPAVPYYHQKDDKGAHAIPTRCDKCSKAFFVVWDTDPT